MDDLAQKVIVSAVSIAGTFLLKEVVYDRWKAKRARKPRFRVIAQGHTDVQGAHMLRVSVLYEAGPDLYDAEPSVEFKILPEAAVSQEVRWLALGRLLKSKRAGLPHDRGNGLPHSCRYAWTEHQDYNPNVPWKQGQTKRFGHGFDLFLPWEYLDVSRPDCATITVGNAHRTWLRHSVDELVRQIYNQLIDERRNHGLLHFDPHGPELNIDVEEQARIVEAKAALDALFSRSTK